MRILKASAVAIALTFGLGAGAASAADMAWPDKPKHHWFHHSAEKVAAATYVAPAATHPHPICGLFKAFFSGHHHKDAVQVSY